MPELVKLPLLPLRGVVLFPNMMVHLDAVRQRSIAAVEAAMRGNRQVLLLTQKDPEKEDPGFGGLYQQGLVAEVSQMVRMPDKGIRVLVEGVKRARALHFYQLVDRDVVEVELQDDVEEASLEMEALARRVIHEFESWVKLSKKIPQDALVSVTMLENKGRLADLIANHLNLTLTDKQEILGLLNVRERMEYLYRVLRRELEILALERRISASTQMRIEKLQKEHYLREKMQAIHQELGEKDSKESDVEEYRQKLREGNYPERVRKVVEKEIRRMETSSSFSAEVSVIRNYIECLLELPWEQLDEDNLNLATAEKLLEKEHYGLEKVKERILDYLAVHKLVKEQAEAAGEKAVQKAPILCLVGPPGVGKTSLATSVAHATGRKFVRASLGGVRDEAEIRGHRRTYVGAMAGRILSSLRRVGTRNPVFLLDEIDKLASDYKGDPSSALLEVLDPAQNNTFSDHFVEIPFDLSQVFWIITANNPAGIPRALRDRMEIINLSSYTLEEKVEIAKHYLIARQRQENGLKANELRLGKGVLEKIISGYTRESGVRELERLIGRICRKAARKLVEGKAERISVAVKDLEEFLGRKKFLGTKAEKKPQIGVVTGMAWTEVGGDILPTEVSILPGKGKLILTGKLGEVMQESAQAGLSYVRSRWQELGLAEDFHEKLDIHIHVAEGAVPKDGPSAGITMATALISALTKRAVRNDVAMTGEITLRGRVLPIGGLREKVLAAYREGIKTIILPKDNERDIEDIPGKVRDELEFFPVETMDEVLEHVWEGEV